MATFYVPREAPEKLIDRIADAASHFPKNFQPYLHIQSQVNKARLAACPESRCVA